MVIGMIPGVEEGREYNPLLLKIYEFMFFDIYV